MQINHFAWRLMLKIAEHFLNGIKADSKPCTVFRRTFHSNFCTDDFCSKEMGLMAPVGQTVEHLLHSGLQYPLS